MTERTKWEEYLICQERGHWPGDMQAPTNPPQSICKKCGTYYWYEPRKLVEGFGKPEAPEVFNPLDLVERCGREGCGHPQPWHKGNGTSSCGYRNKDSISCECREFVND